MSERDHLILRIARAIDEGAEPNGRRRAISIRQAKRAVREISDMTDEEFDTLFNEHDPPEPAQLERNHTA